MKTHGLSNTKIYRIYLSMINRYYKKYDEFYSDYGGRGIRVCQERLTYGYRILDGTTKEEWNNFIDDFQKQHKIRCIICNSETAKNFRVPLLGNNIITINNKIVDDVFFLNHWF